MGGISLECHPSAMGGNVVEEWFGCTFTNMDRFKSGFKKIRETRSFVIDLKYPNALDVERTSMNGGGRAEETSTATEDTSSTEKGLAKPEKAEKAEKNEKPERPKRERAERKEKPTRDRKRKDDDPILDPAPEKVKGFGNDIPAFLKR